MKEISNQLISFLDKHFNKKHSFKISRFSNESKKFLKEIFVLMLESKDYINNIKIKSEYIENHITKGENYDYIPINISNYIENIQQKSYFFSFHLNQKEFNITFIYPKNRKITAHVLNKNIHKIISWLYVATIFSSKKCSKIMNIYIYFTDLLKVLPLNKKLIDEEHVNTAFTTSCSNNTEINIFREEEWFKVLIHETFHNLGLDFSSYNNNIAKNELLSIFNIQSKIHFYETYCETWAEIINVMFINYSSTNQIENMDNYFNILIDKTEKLLHYEKLFSLFQCVKLLHFFGLQYSDLYISSSLQSTKSINYKYKENNTNAFCYYILKSILMFYSNEFIELCIDVNHSSLNFDKSSHKIENNIKLFCNFIREHYNENEYLNYIHIFEKWFEKKNQCNDECSTIRMSLFES